MASQCLPRGPDPRNNIVCAWRSKIDENWGLSAWDIWGFLILILLYATLDSTSPFARYVRHLIEFLQTHLRVLFLLIRSPLQDPSTRATTVPPICDRCGVRIMWSDLHAKTNPPFSSDKDGTDARNNSDPHRGICDPKKVTYLNFARIKTNKNFCRPNSKYFLYL